MNLIITLLILQKAGAGFPSPATDYIEEDIDLKYSSNKKCAIATFRYQGSRKINVNCTGIYDGDLLIVDRSLNPKNFSTVIAKC